MSRKLILAIDTSCDETSIAISNNDAILANELSSQIQSHKEWGGVVPSLAKRKHEELFDLVMTRALKKSGVQLEAIDYFAVTQGPGLAIALEVGIRKAKELSIKYHKPLIAVNHMEGHIYSSLAKNSKFLPELHYQFPLIAILISGGHTEVVLMKSHGVYEILGKTLDDAIGECFDKVGRMLNFGYPAGPVIEKIAKLGDENRYILPKPLYRTKSSDFSYSGLKTAAMKLISEEINPNNIYAQKFISSIKKKNTLKQKDQNSSQVIADIAASFQKAATDHLIDRIKLILSTLSDIGIKDIIIAGGVSQNLYIKKRLRAEFKKNYNLLFPRNKKLFTDNAGMIAVAAYFNFLRSNYVIDINKLDRLPNWELG